MLIHDPSKHLVEVEKTLFADPMVVIVRCVAFILRIRDVQISQLCPAKRTMIMIPFRVLRSPLLESQPDSRQKLFLAL